MKKRMDEMQEMKNIKAPETLKERTLAAAREMRRAEQQSVPQHLTPAPRRSFGMAKRILAVACAFGVIVGGTAVWQSQRTGQSPQDAVAESISNAFGFVAYAADKSEIQQQLDSKIVFGDGAGTDSLDKGFFSGCLFQVTGENIKTVSATIDKGGLYRAKTFADIDKKEIYDMRAAGDAALRAGGSSAEAMAQAAVDSRLAGADLVMPYGTEEDGEWFADVCWKLENGFTEAYDPDASYGFWAESQPFNEEEDLQQAWHSSIDRFEGAKLTVTVTFTDGTQQTQTLTLHTGKLEVEFPEDGSGRRLTGKVLTEDEAQEMPYVYGVYADIA